MRKNEKHFKSGNQSYYKKTRQNALMLGMLQLNQFLISLAHKPKKAHNTLEFKFRIFARIPHIIRSSSQSSYDNFRLLMYCILRYFRFLFRLLQFIIYHSLHRSKLTAELKQASCGMKASLHQYRIGGNK
jgi:hypothetical protein